MGTFLDLSCPQNDSSFPEDSFATNPGLSADKIHVPFVTSSLRAGAYGTPVECRFEAHAGSSWIEEPPPHPGRGLLWVPVISSRVTPPGYRTGCCWLLLSTTWPSDTGHLSCPSVPVTWVKCTPKRLLNILNLPATPGKDVNSSKLV